MNRSILAIISVLLLTIGAAAQSSIKVGADAPVFAGNSLDGATVDLAQLRGKVVVMTFWSTRCAICHSELPKLNRFADRFISDKVVLLAMSMENEEKINGYLRQNPFRFRVMPNSLGTLVQYADRDRSGNLDMGFPSFFVIDQEGVVRHRSSGYGKTEPMAAVVDKLLAR